MGERRDEESILRSLSSSAKILALVINFLSYCVIKRRENSQTHLGHTNLIPGFSSKAGCEFTPTDEAFDIAC